ncbi:MAG: hypothetical protein IM638_15960 [Bacteroidetes bacterium]|nr:hypothetical protein [Bacteroidota bacterium]
MKEKKIEDHLNENVNLYTVFGIFNALTLFAQSIESSKGFFLSQCFMLISILLWAIIRNKIKSNKNLSNLIFLVVFDWIQLIFVFHFFTIQKDKNFPLGIIAICIVIVFFVGRKVKYLLIKKRNKFVLFTRSKSILDASVLMIILILAISIYSLLKYGVYYLLENQNHDGNLFYELSTVVFALHLMKYLSIGIKY